MKVIGIDFVVVLIFYSFNDVFVSSWVYKMFMWIDWLLSDYHNTPHSSHPCPLSPSSPQWPLGTLLPPLPTSVLTPSQGGTFIWVRQNANCHMTRVLPSHSVNNPGVLNPSPSPEWYMSGTTWICGSTWSSGRCVLTVRFSARSSGCIGALSPFLIKHTS